jgi:hypothetical protein
MVIEMLKVLGKLRMDKGVGPFAWGASPSICSMGACRVG